MAGIADVAKKAATTPAIVKAVFEAAAELAKSENVIVKGFGTFKTTKRAARAGRNPQTGVEIQIAAKEVLTFKASK